MGIGVAWPVAPVGDRCRNLKANSYCAWCARAVAEHLLPTVKPAEWPKACRPDREFAGGVGMARPWRGPTKGKPKGKAVAVGPWGSRFDLGKLRGAS
jgi:hypothetical protein